MRTAFASPLAVCLWHAAYASEAPAVPNVVFFKQSWCPISAERAGLSPHFRLTMNGCCIFKAELYGSDTSAAASALDKVRVNLSEQQDLGRCDGDNAELAEVRRAAAISVEAERRQDADVERRQLASRLRETELPLLCMRMGELIREEFTLPEAPAMGGAAIPYVRDELRRRGTSIDFGKARRKLVSVGDTECHLFAAWGLPSSSNHTTVTNRTVVQHVFGLSSYAYTTAGRVTGMQGSR